MDDKPKKKKSDKVAQIERLIELGRYDAADNMLKEMGFHPDTPRLMQALHKARPKREDPVMQRTAHRNRRFMQSAVTVLVVVVLAGVVSGSLLVALFSGTLVSVMGVFWYQSYHDNDDQSVHENYQRPGYSSKKRR